MRCSFKVAVMMAMLSAGSLISLGQAAAGKSSAAGSTVPSASSAPTADSVGPGSAAAKAAVPDTRTEKQKALARQTEKLYDVAAELKVEVDKTNKNILSLKVVEKAEEIESIAKGMKEQAKK